jgi:hypothetical protein
MAIEVHEEFISIGCNRTPNAGDASLVSGRVAFGAHNTVAIWDPRVLASIGWTGLM